VAAARLVSGNGGARCCPLAVTCSSPSREMCDDLCAPGLVVASVDVSGVGICGDETVDREGEVRRAVAAVAFAVVAKVAGRESVAASRLAAWLNRKGCPGGALRQADSAADRANAA
jgi:hypothetical protein